MTKIVWWESVPRGSFARTWKLSSRLFSRPDWLPLGLRGRKTVQVRLPFRVTRRCVQDRNRTLYGLISHALRSTQRLSVLRLTCFHVVSTRPLNTTRFSPVRHQLSHSECKENRFSVGSLLGEQPQPRYSWSQRYRNPQTCVRVYNRTTPHQDVNKTHISCFCKVPAASRVSRQA